MILFSASGLESGSYSPWFSFGGIITACDSPVLLINVSKFTIAEAQKLDDGKQFIHQVIEVPDDIPVCLPLEGGYDYLRRWLSLLPQKVREHIQGEIDSNMSLIYHYRAHNTGLCTA